MDQLQEYSGSAQAQEAVRRENEAFTNREYERLQNVIGDANSADTKIPSTIEVATEPEPYLAKLYRLFSLSQQSINNLLCCVATVFHKEDSLKISNFRAGDITPDALSKLLSSEDQSWADFCFGNNELFELGLLYYDPDDAFNSSELQRPIRVHPRLVRYLKGASGLPTEVADFLSFAQPEEKGGTISGSYRQIWTIRRRNHCGL